MPPARRGLGRESVSCRRRHLLRSRSGGTLCTPGQVCLLSRYSLRLTCDICLEIEEEQFILSCMAVTESQARASLGKPLVFHLRYASQVLQIRSQYLNPGNYRPFSFIQSSTRNFSGLENLVFFACCMVCVFFIFFNHHFYFR